MSEESPQQDQPEAKATASEAPKAATTRKKTVKRVSKKVAKKAPKKESPAKAEDTSDDTAARKQPRRGRTRGKGRQEQPQEPKLKLDQKTVAKRAWKIFLGEVNEEGLALIADKDARELARRSLRVAEIFTQEETLSLKKSQPKNTTSTKKADKPAAKEKTPAPETKDSEEPKED